MGLFGNLFKKNTIEIKDIPTSIVEVNENAGCEVSFASKQAVVLIPEYINDIKILPEQKNNIHRLLCELEVVDNKAVWCAGIKTQSLGFSTWFNKLLMLKNYIWIISIKNDDIYLSRIRANHLVVYKKYTKKNIVALKYYNNIIFKSITIEFNDGYNFNLYVNKNKDLFSSLTSILENEKFI